MEIKALLEKLANENISPEELDSMAGKTMLPALEVPSNISIEATMREVETISTRLYSLHEAAPRDPIIMSRICALLEVKMKLLGMTNVKPDMQAMLDSEMNNYKTRFITIAQHHVEPDTLQALCNALSKEGL